MSIHDTPRAFSCGNLWRFLLAETKLSAAAWPFGCSSTAAPRTIGSTVIRITAALCRRNFTSKANEQQTDDYQYLGHYDVPYRLFGTLVVQGFGSKGKRCKAAISRGTCLRIPFQLALTS
jgi:hypothetical protein